MAEEIYKINTDGYEKELAKVQVKNSAYDLTESELIESGMENTYQYTFPEEPVELVSDPGAPLNYIVILAGHEIGWIVKSYYARLSKAISEGRVESMKVCMVGGRCKTVNQWYDLKGRERHEYLVSKAHYKGYLSLYLKEGGDSCG